MGLWWRWERVVAESSQGRNEIFDVFTRDLCFAVEFRRRVLEIEQRRNGRRLAIVDTNHRVEDIGFGFVV